MKTDMTLFEDYQIRRVYDEEAEIWWFSVIDIVQVLTQQRRFRRRFDAARTGGCAGTLDGGRGD